MKSKFDLLLAKPILCIHWMSCFLLAIKFLIHGQIQPLLHIVISMYTLLYMLPTLALADECLHACWSKASRIHGGDCCYAVLQLDNMRTKITF